MVKRLFALFRVLHGTYLAEFQSPFLSRLIYLISVSLNQLVIHLHQEKARAAEAQDGQEASQGREQRSLGAPEAQSDLQGHQDRQVRQGVLAGGTRGKMKFADKRLHCDTRALQEKELNH